MRFEQDQLIEDINNVVVQDLNLTQTSEQVNDTILSQADIEEIISPVRNNASVSSASTPTSILKSNIAITTSSTAKKTTFVKKKKVTDMK